MIIKVNPQKKYTKISNDDISNISNNALVVYLRFFESHPDYNPTDPNMMIKCKMSKVTYQEAKKELRKKELLYTERTGGKGANIIYHIGSEAVNKILLKKHKKTI